MSPETSRSRVRMRSWLRCGGSSIVLAWITACATTPSTPPASHRDVSSDSRSSIPAPVDEAQSLASAFLSNPEYENLALSPDGKRIAAVSSHGAVDQIVVFDLDGSAGDLALPREVLRERRGERGDRASRAIVELGWAGEDNLVFAIETALRSREDGIPRTKGRSENVMSAYGQRGVGLRARKTRLYSTTLAGRSRYLGKRWQDGPTSQFQHEVIDWLPNDPDHVLLSYEGKAVRVNVKNGGRFTLVTAKSQGSTWAADHAGRIRAGISSRGWDRHIAFHARRSERDPWLTLADYDAYLEPGIWFAGFSPDPSRLYVYSDLETDLTALFEYDLATRTVGRRIAEAETKEGEVGLLIQSEQDDRLLAISSCQDRCDRIDIDPTFAETFAPVDAAFPDRSVGLVDWSQSDERFVLSVSSDVSPPEIWHFDAGSGGLEKVFSAYPGLAGRELSPMKSVRYRTRDGVEIEGFLTRPLNREGPGPLIVIPHDGPEEREYWGFDPVVQYFVARGFSVFQPNYRGSTGYGRKFAARGHGEWSGAIVRDVVDGARSLVASGFADPARIGIYGRGFGGYLALQALVEDPELFAAGASFGAVTDLPLMLADDGRFLGREAVDELFVLPASGAKGGLEAASPVHNAGRMRAPVLIGHGAENPRFHVKHANAMIGALRDAGRVVVPLLYPAATGKFLDDRDRIDFHTRLGDFFEQHLMAARGEARLERDSDEQAFRRIR